MWSFAKPYTFRAADCWIWPKFGQKGQIFCFWSDGLFFYHLLEHHIRLHLVRITFSSDSYCDLQHISKVLLFRTLTLYMGCPRDIVMSWCALHFVVTSYLFIEVHVRSWQFLWDTPYNLAARQKYFIEWNYMMIK